MKLLIDQGGSRLAAEVLRQSGIDAHHVGDIGMAAATDSQIIDMALKDDMVIVTWDSDFHSQIVLSGAAKPSCIRIRVEQLN